MTLDEYLKQERGRAAAVARDIGVPQSTMSNWTADEAESRRPIPVSRRPDLERATQGAVPCEEMGDDVAWARIPDPEWKWHPEGRPLVDVTRIQDATAPTQAAA